MKQYTIPLKYQNFIDNETKRLEEAGLISRSLSNWSAPCMVVPKKQDSDNPCEVQLRMVIDYRQLNKRIITSRAPDRNKIATPTSIEEVCQFNGMCLYYQKFISHYSDISKCFNDMTKKGATFNWTKECNTAFKLLKEKLMEDPVLISPQVDKDYVIHCDASKYSYSGILQ